MKSSIKSYSRFKKEFKTEVSDIFAGLRAALEETVDLPYYENAVAELAKMHSK